MAYAIRFTVKKTSNFRQSGKYTFAEARHSGLTVGRAFGGHRVIDQGEATRFETRELAAKALADYIIQSNWDSNMWVKNPKIIEV